MSPRSPYRILIIDDHPLFRKGLEQLLGLAGGEFSVVGEASSGAEGVELTRHLAPDIVLLDLNMKGMNGIEVLKAIKSRDLASQIIILTVSDAAEDLIAALRSGADGYLLKDMKPGALIDSIRKTAETGQMVLSDQLTNLLVRSLRETPTPKTMGDANLTSQESRILSHIKDGKSNKVIARELGIAEGTVKVHVKRILRKLNLNSRTQAAVWATGKL